MRQPLDPLPTSGAGWRRQHHDRKVGRTVSDTGLHYPRPSRCPGLRWCAGKADATLIQQIDQHGCGRQRGEVAPIDFAAVIGYPSLIGQADMNTKASSSAGRRSQRRSTAWWPAG